MARNLDLTIKFFHLNKTIFPAHWLRKQLNNARMKGSNPANIEVRKNNKGIYTE